MAVENFTAHRFQIWFENTNGEILHPHIMRAFRLGCVLIWYCKEGQTPAPSETAECRQFVDETDEWKAEAVPLGHVKKTTGNLRESRSFFSLGSPVNGKATVVWSEPREMEWSVFKCQRETMREIWTQECVCWMFLGVNFYMSIVWPALEGDLSHCAFPTSDTLLGTPIYVSEIAKSSHSVLEQIPIYLNL
jgi:hypothetical protein